MNEFPRVSILLLSMNHERFISKCIESLISQTYSNIEIIYLDNVSTDKTFERAKFLLEQSNLSFKIFRNHTSKGVSENINFLFKNCSGEYFIPLSSDDWLTENSVEEKVDFLLKNPEYGMVYSSCYYYFFDTNEIKICPQKNEYRQGVVLDDILKENFIKSVGSMIKRTTIEDVGLFDENSPLEDWDMWIRIAEKYPFGYIDKELSFYGRKNGSNITENSEYMLNGIEYIVNKFSKYRQTQHIRERLNYSKCYYYATNKPSWLTLKFILVNGKPKSFYAKQIIKTLIGMLKNLKRPTTLLNTHNLSHE